MKEKQLPKFACGYLQLSNNKRLEGELRENANLTSNSFENSFNFSCLLLSIKEFGLKFFFFWIQITFYETC